MHLLVLFPAKSLKQLKPQSRTMNPLLTTIPLGIVTYGFVRQPVSKQRSIAVYFYELCRILTNP